MKGIRYKTSFQSIQEQQTAHNTVSSAGQKRSWSSIDGESKATSGSNSVAHAPIRFQRAVSLPAAPGQLTASKIVDLRDQGGISEYSQRLRIAATPSSSLDPELDLAHSSYDLPASLISNFASLGIKQIYPWQRNCLKGPGLLSGTKNLVYSAPTGGGKSLVADRKAS